MTVSKRLATLRKLPPISEEAWRGQVYDLAALGGWQWYYVPDSRRVTLAGWPDLALIREPRIIFAELKKQNGKLRPAQAALLPRLAACGLEVAVWRPSDIETVRACLTGRRLPVPPLIL